VSYGEWLLINSNDRDHNQIQIPVAATVLRPQTVQVSPGNLDFGGVEVLSTAQRYVTIANVGQEPLHVSDIKLSGKPAEVTLFSLDLNPPSSAACRSVAPTIAPGDECDVVVTFAPAFAPPLYLPGAWESQLDIYSDDPETPVVQIPVSGIGRLASGQHMDVVPTTIDFGDVRVGTASAPHLVTIANYGTQDLHLRIAPIGDLNFGWDLAGHGACSSATPVLSSGGYCFFRVTFAPLSAGIARGEADILSDDPQHPQLSVSLAGRGK
jgi:hypothetical protein